MKHILMPGMVVGRLTLVSESRNERGDLVWFCNCECGNTKVVLRGCLISKNTRSCGCLMVDRPKELHTTHGDTVNRKTTAEFRIHHGMMNRCYLKSEKHYSSYGGRGIVVCDRWHDFKNFLEDMGRRPSRNHSLDRIDNNGNYEKDNCRWATRIEQANNTRRNRFLEFNGENLTIANWARKLNIPDNILSYRLSKGWSAEDTLTTLPEKAEKLVEHNGETMNIASWAKKTGLSRYLIADRLSHGWTPEEALTRAKATKIKQDTLTYNNRTMTMYAWSKETGLSSAVIYGRIKLGWSISDTLTIPAGGSTGTIEINGEKLTASQWSKKSGISSSLILARVASGWTGEEILKAPRKAKDPELEYDGKNLKLSEWATLLGVELKMLRRRVREGWSANRIFTTPFIHLPNHKKST